MLETYQLFTHFRQTAAVAARRKAPVTERVKLVVTKQKRLVSCIIALD